MNLTVEEGEFVACRELDGVGDGTWDQTSRHHPGGWLVIRVVLAEDQGMVLSAFASLLELEDDIEMVATRQRGGSPGSG